MSMAKNHELWAIHIEEALEMNGGTYENTNLQAQLFSWVGK